MLYEVTQSLCVQLQPRYGSTMFDTNPRTDLGDVAVHTSLDYIIHMFHNQRVAWEYGTKRPIYIF